MNDDDLVAELRRKTSTQSTRKPLPKNTALSQIQSDLISEPGSMPRQQGIIQHKYLLIIDQYPNGTLYPKPLIPLGKGNKNTKGSRKKVIKKGEQVKIQGVEEL